jgi:hypothetical protein
MKRVTSAIHSVTTAAMPLPDEGSGEYKHADGHEHATQAGVGTALALYGVYSASDPKEPMVKRKPDLLLRLGRGAVQKVASRCFSTEL